MTFTLCLAIRSKKTEPELSGLAIREGLVAVLSEPAEVFVSIAPAYV